MRTAVRRVGGRAVRRVGGRAALTGLVAGVVALLVVIGVDASQGRYLEKDTFLELAFGDAQIEQEALFVHASLRESVEDVLERTFELLRVRYWRAGSGTAWILEEIGKEEPITIGVAIENDSVAMVRILEFRESRGWEVRYPFFTDQFSGAKLADGTSIDRGIDGITGATLSVDAVNRVVRLALLLHGHATRSTATRSPKS